MKFRSMFCHKSDIKIKLQTQGKKEKNEKNEKKDNDCNSDIIL